MEILVLRFDSPLMSFGGVIVDQHGVIDRFPGKSFLAGLFGNALGYSHGDSGLLNKLQSRIEFAARWDIEPEKIVDYHTVCLGQEKMRSPGWTTRGEPEHRSGGDAAKFGTHQRYRHYWVNGVMTLTATFLDEPGDENDPSIASLATKLAEPVRPLFLGRKTCLPSAPLLLAVVTEEDVLKALKKVPPMIRNRREAKLCMEACWPSRLEPSETQHRRVRVYDSRDWVTQLHTGSRIRVEGKLEVSAQ
jgi:CRISPR system Cascade subunit CasD